MRVLFFSINIFEIYHGSTTTTGKKSKTLCMILLKGVRGTIDRPMQKCDAYDLTSAMIAMEGMKHFNDNSYKICYCYCTCYVAIFAKTKSDNFKCLSNDLLAGR